MGLKEVSSDYTVSLHYDRRLYKQDIEGSIAHARMLAKQEIIEHVDATAIVEGLGRISDEIESNTFPWRPEHEDIHMNIELRLHELIGEPALKLHTARSRNDQVALDMRMYMKEVISETLNALSGLQRSLIQLAEDNIDVVMPGYTHLQRAQPVLFAHHMLAYFQMFDRDQSRFRQAYERADVMPLGSGALAGLPYPLDREFVRRELGFARISENSMDAVSDRDFMLDFLSAASICAMHISRFAEELVLWSTDEFDFIRLSDDYTTGSSIMPQKRNPDFAEIARGKTGRVYGNLLALLTTMKGLPLTYNRDLQEDKEGLFDTIDTLIPTLTIFADMISKMSLNKSRLLDAAQGSY
ncbi:MAG: argininosuccinate lyase, partial [Chloroflexi bacterium]|nr:argininosuccinate lyase [Chloroflexota bacterium]